MKLKFSYVFLFGLMNFFPFMTKAQSSAAGDFEQWIIELDSNSLSIDEEPLYILNGVILKSEDVDKTLSQYQFKTDKLAIQFLSKSVSGHTIFCAPPRAIILLNDLKNSQKRKAKLESLQKALSFYKEPTLKTAHGQLFNTTPIVLFDGIELAKDQTHTFLSQLKPSDIDHILVSENGPKGIFGKNASNGLIRVWLK